MKEKTCCFTGHRNISENEYEHIKTELYRTICDLINKGVIYFGSGGAIGFDMLAAQVVLDLKKYYPQIKLIMVYPCKNQTRFWSETDKTNFINIKNACCKYVYISEEYDNACMQKRNRHLVDNSKYCICYLNKTSGGTAYTVNYANKKGLTIINIAQ